MSRQPCHRLLAQADDALGLFFLFLAVLNEVVWRNYPTDIWVAFKVWGTMPITLAFTLSQMPLILKHGAEKPEV
jgi:intracellular septation protein